MAEGLELGDKPFGDAFGIALAVVVAAEVVVELAGAEHVPEVAQDRVLDRAERFLVTAPRLEPLVLGGEVAVVDLDRGHGGLFERYPANQQRLRSNQRPPRGEGGGAAPEGRALLQGLIRCGRCGRRMQVGYSCKTLVPNYSCVRGNQLHRPGHDRARAPAASLALVHVAVVDTDRLNVDEDLAVARGSGRRRRRGPRTPRARRCVRTRLRASHYSVRVEATCERVAAINRATHVVCLPLQRPQGRSQRCEHRRPAPPGRGP